MRKCEKELEYLRKLFNEGAFTPDFYRKKLYSLDQLKDYDSFCNIPFTYKKEIRDTSVEERTTTKRGEIYGVFSSSGTTGEKTYYIYNKKDKAVHEEFVRYFYTELGIKETDIGGVLAPVDTGVMAHTMMWQFTTMGAGYVNCPSPTPESIIETINKVPVSVVATRPSIASSIAYNELFKNMAKSSNVNKLLMGGGFLSKERRKLLEESWGADCYNMFGMSEMFGPMAGECRQKNGLHYLDDYLLIEIIDPKSLKPVEEGEVGVAVYTTLWDKGFPLLRYWTDDLMCITSEPCKCGSKHPRLYFKGRLKDCFFIGGKYIFPENLENILFKYGFIGEYCAEKQNYKIIVKTEGSSMIIPNRMRKEIVNLFGRNDVEIEAVLPGSLNYDGHSKRFIVEQENR